MGLGRKLNAAITAAEAKEAQALAKLTRKAEDKREAEILRRSAAVLKGKK